MGRDQIHRRSLLSRVGGRFTIGDDRQGKGLANRGIGRRFPRGGDSVRWRTRQPLVEVQPYLLVATAGEKRVGQLRPLRPTQQRPRQPQRIVAVDILEVHFSYCATSTSYSLGRETIRRGCPFSDCSPRVRI